MKIDKNIIIKCNNLEEVKDCLDKLKELGFNVCFNNNKDQLIVNQSRDINSFRNYIWTKFYPENFCVNYKTFLKLYNKQIKENEPDLVVDKNGKILKVNNGKKMYTIYFFDPYGEYIHNVDRTGKALQDSINYANYYISEEACEKALKRKEIENKLKMVAETLNNQVKHMYSLFETNIPKYSISIEYTRFLETKLCCYRCGNNFIQHQGTIYCLDENFLDKAIEIIGEKDLKDYLINY